MPGSRLQPAASFAAGLVLHAVLGLSAQLQAVAFGRRFVCALSLLLRAIACDF
jgi:hypothetical protein